MQTAASKVGRFLAKLLGRFLAPLTVFRLLGVLPYRPVSYRAFEPLPRCEQIPQTRRHPSSIHAKEAWSFSLAGDLVMGHLVNVAGGLAAASGQVFSASGELIQGASHKYRARIKGALVIRPFRPGSRIPHFDERVAVLTASTQHYYYHWLFDVLPRIGMLEEAGAEADRFYIQVEQPFQRETATLLGLTPDRIIDCEEAPLLSARSLVVPCHQVMDGREVPPWVCAFLRSRFLRAQEVLPPADAPAERLYLARTGARHRRIRNEAEISRFLEGRGFAEVAPERLPVVDQARLFERARVIVAPHGGALANLVFCSPGTRVIELFPADSIDLYFRISRALKLDYYYLKSGTRKDEHWQVRDYEVDLAGLERTLALAKIPD